MTNETIVKKAKKKIDYKSIIFKNKKKMIKMWKKDENIDFIKQAILNTFLFGIPLNAALVLIGFSFTPLHIIELGLGAWVIEEKLVNWIERILSSITLVRVSN